MQQASSTIAHYLIEVRELVDSQFGAGYAAKHPELVGQLVQACASDYLAANLGVLSQEVSEALGEVADKIGLRAEE